MDSCDDLLSPFYAALDDELASNSLNFPTSFDLITRAMRVMDDPNSSMKDYATLVQSEPVLLAKVLRMANSVVMNPYGKTITSAFEAVQRLGSKKIRCLVYLVMMEQIRQDNRSEALKRTANVIWKHSLDVACLSYCLAKQTRICDPDESLLSGIMIDIGQFFILSRVSVYPEITKSDKCFTELLKKSHVSIAKQIIDVLKLPRVVIDVYNCNLSRHPVWPMENIVDIITMASVCTNYANPFLQGIDDSKKREFFDMLSKSEASLVEQLISDIDELRDEMFDSLSG